MQKNSKINLKYDDYQEDFQDNDYKPQMNDYNMQTQPRENFKAEQKSPKNKTQQHYDDDFVETNSPHQSAPNKNESRLTTQNKQQSMPRKLANDITNPNREKMIEQNIKLKTQIYQLAKQMDEIMNKQKKPKKYGIHADEDQDQMLKAKKVQLKKQQSEIMSLKNKIFVIKRQLEHVYDSRGIQGKQDQLKSLQKELDTLQNQKQALTKVKKQQTKALKLIRNDNEYEEKIRGLKQNISKVKEECRILSQTLVQNERYLRKNHELYLTKQAKIKEMEQKIRESKEKEKSRAKKSGAKQELSQQTITPEMITQLDKQIAQLQKERKESEKMWNDKISAIESQIQQKKMEEEKKLLILKDKEKQLRLNELRIKQLKKLINHHQSEINQKKKASTSEKQHDMKEFRHKRNIKQLQK